MMKQIIRICVLILGLISFQVIQCQADEISSLVARISTGMTANRLGIRSGTAEIEYFQKNYETTVGKKTAKPGILNGTSYAHYKVVFNREKDFYLIDTKKEEAFLGDPPKPPSRSSGRGRSGGTAFVRSFKMNHRDVFHKDRHDTYHYDGDYWINVRAKDDSHVDFPYGMQLFKYGINCLPEQNFSELLQSAKEGYELNKINIDGRDLIQFTFRWDLKSYPSYYIERVFTFSPQEGYMLIRYESYTRDFNDNRQRSLNVLMTCEPTKINGVFFPKRIIYGTYGGNEDRPKSINEYLLDFSLNVPVNISQWDIKPAPGQHIWDKTRDTSYRAPEE